jgi:hypothetical protein
MRLGEGSAEKHDESIIAILSAIRELMHPPAPKGRESPEGPGSWLLYSRRWRWCFDWIVQTW